MTSETNIQSSRTTAQLSIKGIGRLMSYIMKLLLEMTNYEEFIFSLS